MVDHDTCREVTVISRGPLSQAGQQSGLWRLAVANPGWDKVAAGQFAMLRPPSFGLEMAWARPFSIFGVTPGTVEFFIQTTGRGTARLAELSPGDPLVMWGPLGRGFAVEPDTPTLLLAGGVGIAPFGPYIASHPAPGILRLLFGHRVPLDAYPFAAMAGTIRAESFHEKEPGDLDRFLGLLRERVAGYSGGLVLACGPRPFLAAVADMGRAVGARVQVSLENRMACGVGACLGCVEKDVTGQLLQTCVRGPVFWAKDLAAFSGEPGTAGESGGCACGS
ncbi:dihydroorotate dehydrogenase electron transfer subunit [Desulfolutivibrio sulfoxidireducens]|uniref:iron-sulfur cluster-binding protein n=1 Tax=Desulfolutivibrio sulfoxidireducens TaxID=2773299 RepID=UPI00159D1A47|nr:dihydroorotate dehydrogenase electron transfer subunit [Desulfolutivibrio sulfoxidireducens]QLA19589.1 dihydroorotate dehydrogenase electron transfer subunit [Desulfolutivibrio sulfoxidireducens]